MNKVEKLLLIIYASILALLFTEPALIYIFMVAFIQPENLVEFENWDNYFALTLIIANLIMFGFYFNEELKRKIITWAVSSLLWFGFIVYFIDKYEPFINFWLIWLPHMVMLLISLSALTLLCWPNNTLKQGASHGTAEKRAAP